MAALVVGQPAQAEIRALIVAVSKYAEPIPSLEGPPNDAAALQALLRQQGASDITTMTDAQATRATVSLHRSNGAVAFTVADDGTGFDPAATGYGTGLQGIADRLGALDGELEVTSRPGAGTTVSGRVPVDGEPHGRVDA